MSLFKMKLRNSQRIHRKRSATMKSTNRNFINNIKLQLQKLFKYDTNRKCRHYPQVTGGVILLSSIEWVIFVIREIILHGFFLFKLLFCEFFPPQFVKFYQELLKENSNPWLKGNRKGIIVKGKEFYIPILNTFPTR